MSKSVSTPLQMSRNVINTQDKEKNGSVFVTEDITNA